MSEKRFYVETVAVREKVITDKDKFYSYEDLDEIVALLNEQQSNIKHLETYSAYLEADVKRLMKKNKELGKNFDDLVNWASEIANRNVVLDEEIGQLQRENEQLKQILKDIVVATDETYTKSRSIYKISVVFDNETYLKIRECLND